MDVKEFANKLKSLRVMKGVLQEEVSNALGMSRVGYSKYEKGINKSLPNADQMAIIARVLDVPVETLLGADEFILQRYSDEEMELMKDPASTDYIKVALAKFKENQKYATKALYQRTLDSSVKNTVVAEFSRKLDKAYIKDEK